MSTKFEGFKKSFGDWFSKAADKAEEFTREAAGKAEEVTKLGKVKLDIFQIKRDVEKNHTRMGKLVFDLVLGKKEANIEKHAEVLAIVKEIQELEKKKSAKENEYEKIKEVSKNAAEPAEETPETKTAPPKKTEKKVKSDKKSDKSSKKTKK